MPSRTKCRWSNTRLALPRMLLLRHVTVFSIAQWEMALVAIDRLRERTTKQSPDRTCIMRVLGWLRRDCRRSCGEPFLIRCDTAREPRHGLKCGNERAASTRERYLVARHRFATLDLNW